VHFHQNKCPTNHQEEGRLGVFKRSLEWTWPPLIHFQPPILFLKHKRESQKNSFLCSLVSSLLHSLWSLSSVALWSLWSLCLYDTCSSKSFMKPCCVLLCYKIKGWCKFVITMYISLVTMQIVCLWAPC